MKYCKHCNLYHEENHKICIVCGNNLVEKAFETNLVTPGYPEVQVNRKKPNIPARVLILIGIVVSLISVVINILTFKDTKIMWSIIVVGSLFYVYLLIKQVIISKRDYSTKTLKQVIIVSLILLILDYATAYKAWAITYAIPLVLVGTTAFLPIVVASMPKKYYMHVRNLFWLIILNLIYAAIAFFSSWTLEGVYWTGAMTLIAGFTLFSAMLLFAPKVTYQELVKFFHI
ncbi:DUF6320 domain-containing protein [Acholeplasma hippikon]|uniref:Zinc ribbon domain-containing protein n=1 Tax=Acholeplasma hippikon TaxID=264636 RepID=A0A449BJJ5_9MOLU|nr:DUF6320 domain-containing protein [Acholeplasma hippikon]VEU82635.1 Uncharacterised protein [Acholeplasma hippikon]